uniref:Metalloprotease TIKI homolog n=1 Tax=Elaeophora elaphi TaxID=1147741 RepID=A0A0R3S0F0_9BILA
MRRYRNQPERQYDRKETRNRPRNMFRNIVEGWERRRPVWLLFLLYQLSEKYLYREHTPMLDLFLAQYALELNKKLYSIETATEQCNPLRSVRMDQIDDQLREDIIERRNIRMADRIAKLLRWKVGNQYFFALGAGHFLGRKSILALLESHGFVTKAVTENDEISFREHENDRRVYVFNELWVRDEDIKTDPAIDIMLTVAELPNSRSSAKIGRSQITISIVLIIISFVML